MRTIFNIFREFLVKRVLFIIYFFTMFFTLINKRIYFLANIWNSFLSFFKLFVNPIINIIYLFIKFIKKMIFVGQTLFIEIFLFNFYSLKFIYLFLLKYKNLVYNFFLNITKNFYIFLMVVIPTYSFLYILLAIIGFICYYRFLISPLIIYSYTEFFIKSYTLIFIVCIAPFFYLYLISKRVAQRLNESFLFYLFLCYGNWDLNSWQPKFFVDKKDFDAYWFELVIDNLSMIKRTFLYYFF